MSYFEKRKDELERLEGPDKGFTIPVIGRQVLAPWDNKERVVDEYITKHGLSEFDSQYGLSEKLKNSAPNDWGSIVRGAAGRQAEIGGRYNVQGQEVAGRYALQGQEVMGRYNLEGTRIGANASIRQAEIGANASRDVANIGGGWNYRAADLTSGRQLQGQRESLASDERRQTQNLLANRQAMGQEMKRQEASELVQARLQRGDSGRNFLLQVVGQKQWFR